MAASLLILFLILIILVSCQNYQIFENFQSDYPCRTFLSDRDFLKHMIPHHQIAIDISTQHIKNTKNDIIMKVLRELIWTQNYEILVMKEELSHTTENISEITGNEPVIPSITSTVYPNVSGLTNTYCDPSFFTSSADHQQHSGHNMVVTDKQYIQHMIPHHQVAVDMCKILLKNTKSDFLTQLAYRMIKAQEAEIILLNDLLTSRFIM
jgi:hypothetical protein